MRKRVCFFGAVVSLCMVAMSIVRPISNITASANSAQSHWQGVDSMGAIIMESQCPIEVQHEKLVFDIPQFPANYYSEIEDFATYNASLSATYTFYNPADYTVKARLAFPFGMLPDYAPYVYDEDWNISVPFSDTDKYGITVDGKEIEKSLRYSLAGAYEGFDIEKCLPYLGDSFVEDEFFTPNMVVTKYSYEVSGISQEDVDAYASFYHSSDPAKTRVWLCDSIVERGSYGFYLGDFVDNGQVFTLYVFGEELSTAPAWTVYEDMGTSKKIEGKVIENVSKREVLTFEEFAFSRYFGEFSQQNMISEVDWYNSVVYSLHNADYGYGTIDDFDVGGDLVSDFMRWYQYEIEIPAKSTLVNTVTAPIYPSIDAGWNPAIFQYTYLLSPAKTWKEFGALEIEIHTPYYLIDDKNGFVKTDTGYTLSLDGLPEGELTFTLSSAENPEKTLNTYGCLSGCMIAVLLPFAYISDAVGCYSVVGICTAYAPIVLSAIFLLFKKRK